MSITTEAMLQTKPEQAGSELSWDVKAHYRRVLRRRLMWMFAVVAVILCTVVLDFTMGPSGLTLMHSGRPWCRRKVYQRAPV